MEPATHAPEDDYASQRHAMVERQLRGRGVRDERILDAMRTVPRERFVPENLREFAYLDTPLPIERGQTISQPLIVAAMLDALTLPEHARVLEIGTGSGYSVAVLSCIAAHVFGIERDETLHRLGSDRLRTLGYDNVTLRHGDGTLGWPEHAPFDAIVVTAGGPAVPTPLTDQLAIGGKLVIPIGPLQRAQKLVRITRTSETEFEQEDLGPVAFVPLIGEQGWQLEHPGLPPLPELIGAHAEPFETIETADLDALLDRIGDARVVCLGEATHGTSEFYRMRHRITQALVERKGFDVVALEADWPDAARIDQYVRALDVPVERWQTFSRFPTWMWRNREFRGFVDALRDHNAARDGTEQVGLYGLDLYSLHTSIDRVLAYLDEVDPETAAVARERYGCLTPWQTSPAAYGLATLTGKYRACEAEVTAMLEDLLSKRLEYAAQIDGERFFDAAQNARLVRDAERYYRTMYYGGACSWNLRDQHMFDTLISILQTRGPQSRAVVWAHNSHLGDASFTEVSTRGEYNIGQLCRERFREQAVLIGFGTDRGTVAAASDWGGPVEFKTLRPSDEHSHEHQCHRSAVPRFILPLREPSPVHEALTASRLERAVGVIYRPETELASHYFRASLSRQFDEWIWFDETHAVTPLEAAALRDVPETYPFGL